MKRYIEEAFLLYHLSESGQKGDFRKTNVKLVFLKCTSTFDL